MLWVLERHRLPGGDASLLPILGTSLDAGVDVWKPHVDMFLMSWRLASTADPSSLRSNLGRQAGLADRAMLNCSH